MALLLLLKHRKSKEAVALVGTELTWTKRVVGLLRRLVLLLLVLQVAKLARHVVPLAL